MSAIKVISPAGVSTWIDVSDRSLTLMQVKQKAVDVLPWTPGQHADNVQLILDGKTVAESIPVSKCTFLPSSVIHLVLQVHGG